MVFPAARHGDDVCIHAPERPEQELTRSVSCVSKQRRESLQPHWCLADFVAPAGGPPDYLGRLRSTAGSGWKSVWRSQGQHDDYRAIMLEALAIDWPRRFARVTSTDALDGSGAMSKREPHPRANPERGLPWHSTRRGLPRLRPITARSVSCGRWLDVNAQRHAGSRNPAPCGRPAASAAIFFPSRRALLRRRKVAGIRSRTTTGAKDVAGRSERWLGPYLGTWPDRASRIPATDCPPRQRWPGDSAGEATAELRWSAPQAENCLGTQDGGSPPPTYLAFESRAKLGPKVVMS